MNRWVVSLLLIATGCNSADDVARWAVDPVWIEPTNDGGIHGFQNWAIYSAKWTKHYKEKFFVCTVVTEFEGQAIDAGDGCEGCTGAWAVETSYVESDCNANLAENPGFLALSRIAVGDLNAELTADDPFPNKSIGGYADYGTNEWVVHGWAYPEALETDASTTPLTWDDTQAFKLEPAFIWDLNRAP